MKKPILFIALAALVTFLGCSTRETPANSAAGEKHSMTLTTANFDAEVLASQKPVLVDFWATWCGPCKIIAPIVEEIAAEYKGKVVVGKLDVDQNGDIASKYGIEGIPTLLVFKGGKVVDRIVGVVPKETITGKLTAALADNS